MKILYILQNLFCEKEALPTIVSTKEFDSFAAAASLAKEEANAFFATYQSAATMNDESLPVFHHNDDPDATDSNLLYWIVGCDFSDFWFITEIYLDK